MSLRGAVWPGVVSPCPQLTSETQRRRTFYRQQTAGPSLDRERCCPDQLHSQFWLQRVSGRAWGPRVQGGGTWAETEGRLPSQVGSPVLGCLRARRSSPH